MFKNILQKWETAAAETTTSPPVAEPLVHVSTPAMFLSMVPLAVLALVSSFMGLELASPIVVGTIRTFVQLTVLGLILQPIFVLGTELWWLVLLYVIFMVLLAAQESTARSTYYFRGIFPAILGALLVNVTLVSAFAFGVIVRPIPLWNPQYVIPIVGMLLGNCINGISLSLNAILTSLVEQSREVELLLSYGASSREASSRLLRNAVRTGAMPMLNSMAVIGLISIPGMMTGQILGGAPVMEAARYQMLIVYLISMCAFGTIFSEVWIATRVGFDTSSHMLRSDRFIKRAETLSFLGVIASLPGRLCCCCGFGNDIVPNEKGRPPLVSSPSNNSSEMEALTNGDDAEVPSSYVAPKGTLQVNALGSSSGSGSKQPNLEILHVSCSVPVDDRQVRRGRRVLFRDLSVSIEAGEIATVSGPSGVGKTQLLRVVAGLSRMDKGGGDIILNGKSRSDYADMTVWRQQVRYVTQYKVDVPGTPRQFIRRVTSLLSWRSRGQQEEGEAAAAPTFDEMVTASLEFVQSWGMDPNCLEKEWSLLSGGEAQRVIVALALASRPRVLLLDEATSALDLDSKTRVERSVEDFAKVHSVSVLWITHDQDQIDRMSSGGEYDSSRSGLYSS